MTTKLKFRKGEKIIVRIYGKDFDLTEKFKKGQTVFEIFGDKYEIEIVEIKNAKKESRK